MANQQETKREFTAKTLKATKAEGKNGPYWEFDLVEAGQERVYTWRMFDATAGAAIEVGKIYAWTAGTRPTDRGGIFRNLYKAELVAATEAPQPTAAKVPAPPNGFKDYTAERTSIERQKALAEARAGADFLVGQWFEANRNTTVAAGQEMPWPQFEEAFRPVYEELVTKLAARFYKAIRGKEEA